MATMEQERTITIKLPDYVTGTRRARVAYTALKKAIENDRHLAFQEPADTSGKILNGDAGPNYQRLLAEWNIA